MKTIYNSIKAFVIILILLIPHLSTAQTWVLVGRNEASPDGFSIVCTKAVTIADIAYVTEEEYNSAFDNFSGLTEGTAKYTPPGGGHAIGEVITIQETGTTSNIWEIVGCSSGTCGTVTTLNTGSISIGETDELYSYSDSDDDPTNGITEIYSVWFWNGSESPGEDPTGDFPNAIKLSIVGDVPHVDFTVAERLLNVSKADFQDISKYTIAGGNLPLSTVPFTGGILPVNLISFKSKIRTNKVALEWSTASEVNNDFFEIERSADGIEFKSIGRVRGNGNTYESSFYSFLDRNPLYGFNYYRLRQVDFDGRFEYSNILSEEFRLSDRDLTVYPNPVINVMELTLGKGFPTDMDIEIYNSLGQIIFSEVLAEDQLKKDLDISMLRSGTYTLKIGNGENAIVRRIVKI